MKFANDFWNLFGIDVNDAKVGAWWEGTDHLKNAYEYNQSWRRWLAENAHATYDDAKRFADSLAEKYEFIFEP